jgi:hypothetical protein
MHPYHFRASCLHGICPIHTPIPGDRRGDFSRATGCAGDDYQLGRWKWLKGIFVMIAIAMLSNLARSISRQQGPGRTSWASGHDVS